jgi:hypothetical protein
VIARWLGAACARWKYDLRPRVVKALDDEVIGRQTRFADKVAAFDPALSMARRAERRRDRSKREIYSEGWEKGARAVLDTLREVEAGRHQARARLNPQVPPLDSLEPEVQRSVQAMKLRLDDWAT